MKTLASVGSAMLGMLAGITLLAFVSPSMEHPAQIIGFGGAGAVVGILVIPRIARWIREAFAAEKRRDP